MMLDAVVIGGGPAGRAAATWLARYRGRCGCWTAGVPQPLGEACHGYLSPRAVRADRRRRSSRCG
jgi:thioredoxin reductase